MKKIELIDDDGLYLLKLEDKEFIINEDDYDDIFSFIKKLEKERTLNLINLNYLHTND